MKKLLLILVLSAAAYGQQQLAGDPQTVREAIASGQWIAVHSDTGSDAFAGCPTPPLTAYAEDMVVRLTSQDVGNTDGATLDLCSLGALPIDKNHDGIALDTGDIAVGEPITLEFCQACNSAAGAWKATVANTSGFAPASRYETGGATPLDLGNMDGTLPIATSSDIGGTSPIVMSGANVTCPTCVAEDGNGDAVITRDLTVTRNLIVGDGSYDFSTQRVELIVTDSATTNTVGDKQRCFVVPGTAAGVPNPWANSLNLTALGGQVDTAESSATLTVQLERRRSGSTVDMLTTKLTWDATETSTATATAAAVINASNDDIEPDDRICADTDVATDSKGMLIWLVFAPPAP